MDGSENHGNVGCAALLTNNITKRKLNENNVTFTAELYTVLNVLLIINNSQNTNFIIFSVQEAGYMQFKYTIVVIRFW